MRRTDIAGIIPYLGFDQKLPTHYSLTWHYCLDADEAARSAANMDAPTHGELRRDVMWAVGG
jgi:hypothetical protein